METAVRAASSAMATTQPPPPPPQVVPRHHLLRRSSFPVLSRRTNKSVLLTASAIPNNGAAPRPSPGSAALSRMVKESYGQRSSLESLFCYDKSIPEERIEKPIGLAVDDKLIGDKCPCPDCQAKGVILCKTCSGSGLYVDSVLESQGIIVKVRCLGCGGTGNIMCSDCGGRGHM